MSFFSKIKQGLGLGTLKVELQVPAQLGKDEREVKGEIVLTAQSDQQIKDIKIRMLETYTKGSGDDKKTKEYELGQKLFTEAFELKKGETKTIAFVLPFILQRSSNQSLAEEKGMLGALGKAAMFANSEKSEFEIKVDTHLEGSMFSISDSQEIRFA